ncbi:MAG: hypothetical protein WKG07_26620 [Hymenobacter sp.]
MKTSACMPPPISRSVQPCPESWAAMTPTATGRHCAACAKTVVDFSRMSDGEILAFLARHASAHSPGKLCGRVAAPQLGRPLQPLSWPGRRGGGRGWRQSWRYGASGKQPALRPKRRRQ